MGNIYLASTGQKESNIECAVRSNKRTVCGVMCAVCRIQEVKIPVMSIVPTMSI